MGAVSKVRFHIIPAKAGIHKSLIFTLQRFRIKYGMMPLGCLYVAIQYPALHQSYHFGLYRVIQS